MRMRFLFLAFAGLLIPGIASAQTPIKLQLSDGVTVYGARYPAAGKAVATILLFHQAGSNRAEYATIAPRLAKAGFDAIAIDQRSGGDMFGQQNNTVEALGGPTGYLGALADLQAALAFAQETQPGRPVLLWGSSYSASLVFLLASRHPKDVAAVLAFSPGEYFGGDLSVAKAASEVEVPIFVTSAPTAGEVKEAKTILAAAPAKIKVQFVPKVGQHGSSTLRADVNPDGAEEVWSAVTEFLNKVATPEG